jgi:Tfp pilus assembly protein PilV
MMYLIVGLLVLGAGGLGLFFWLLQREAFGPAARARQRAAQQARRQIAAPVPPAAE